MTKAEAISYVSSVATLILFVLYFIGRIWVINKNKKMSFEKFNVNYIKDDQAERKNQYDLGGEELLTVSSSQGLNWVKVYKVEFDDKKKQMVLSNKKPIVYHKLLNIDENLYLKTMVVGIMPRYRIKYQRFDYIQGSFDIVLNGRYGGINMNGLKTKLTFRSYLYYICK